MEQLTFLEAGKVEWREVPTPTLEGDRQAIVRPGARYVWSNASSVAI